MKILLATDGSEFSLAAAKACCRMINFSKPAKIRIINVIDLIPPPMRPLSKDSYPAEEKASKRAAEIIVEETLLKMREFLDNTNVDIETKTISGEAKNVIAKEAEDWEADLIIVGSHGYGFWSRALLGSVSDAVVKYSKCSVLVVQKDKTLIEI